METICRPASVTEIRPLRHAVLRAGLPAESANFPGDDNATTRHFAAERDGLIVACLSMMLNEFDGKPAWQLRGMAVEATVRGTGIGATLLAYAEEAVAADSPVRRFWCNARKPAVGFYERQDWRVVSAEFDIPTAGPHFRMGKGL